MGAVRLSGVDDVASLQGPVLKASGWRRREWHRRETDQILCDGLVAYDAIIDIVDFVIACGFSIKF